MIVQNQDVNIPLNSSYREMKSVNIVEKSSHLIMCTDPMAISLILDYVKSLFWLCYLCFFSAKCK